MPAFLPFEQQLAAAWPVDTWRDVRVLVAVSGGPDSVSLLSGIQRLSPSTDRLAVAHFNHGVRGEAALTDQRFVQELCQSLGIECIVGQADLATTSAAGEGLESTLRAARYRFLTQAAEQLGARYVATGHTADDQAETILYHVLRGTGLRGLAGMRRFRPLSPAVTLVRPLLQISRAAVIEYLAAIGQACQHDETNVDRSMTRNRIRHELLPMLARDYSPAVVESLLRLGAVADNAQQMMDVHAEALLTRCLLEFSAGQVVIDCTALSGQARHLVREVMVAIWRRQCWPRQAMGQAQWDALAEMALATTEDVTARLFPGAIRVERRAQRLTVNC